MRGMAVGSCELIDLAAKVRLSAPRNVLIETRRTSKVSIGHEPAGRLLSIHSAPPWPTNRLGARLFRYSATTPGLPHAENRQCIGHSIGHGPPAARASHTKHTAQRNLPGFRYNLYGINRDGRGMTARAMNVGVVDGA